MISRHEFLRETGTESRGERQVSIYWEAIWYYRGKLILRGSLYSDTVQ